MYILVSAVKMNVVSFDKLYSCTGTFYEGDKLRYVYFEVLG